MRKILLLILIHILSTFLMGEGTQPAGTGTATDLYQITTLDNLLWVSTNESCWSSYFLQKADIDATDTQNWNNGAGFSPIGSDDFPFSGNYNGSNNVIDGLYINRPGFENTGLFGYTSEAFIEALGVTNVIVNGGEEAGGLVGWNNSSWISKCFSSGIVTGTSYNVGGLAGKIAVSMLCASYSTCNVIGNDAVGGLAGYNTSSTISDCFASGDVTGDSDGGGLVGINFFSGTISDCYATGSVSAEINAGGLVGWNYSGTIYSSIWNIDSFPQNEGVGANYNGEITDLLGKTSAEMFQMSTYTDIGWDFVGETVNGLEDIWEINSVLNNGFAYISDLEWSLAYGELVADFSADPTSGNLPLTVTFSDGSVPENAIVSWQWDFENDGVIDSFEQNPVWVCNEPGIYSVRLTVSDAAGRDTAMELKEDYIEVLNPVAYGDIDDNGEVESYDVS